MNKLFMTLVAENDRLPLMPPRASGENSLSLSAPAV